MDFDAPIKLELDTKKAKQQTRDLARSRVRSKKRQTEVSNRRSPISGKLSGKLSKLAGGASGYTAVNRILHSGQNSPWDAWQRPLQALAMQKVDEFIGYSARAKMTAMSRTQQKLGFASRPGQSLQPARDFYERESVIQNEVEAGRNLLRSDPTFSGVDFVALLEKSVSGYFDLLRKSFGYIGDAFTGK